VKDNSEPTVGAGFNSSSLDRSGQKVSVATADGVQRNTGSSPRSARSGDLISLRMAPDEMVGGWFN
jgi:hypothetical protein